MPKTASKTKPQASLVRPKIRDVDSAGSVLQEVARLSREIEAVERDAEARILKIQNDVDRKVSRDRKRLEALKEGLERFAIKSREKVFGAKKSIRLSGGRIGFRGSESIIVSDDTMALIQKTGRSSEAIRAKFEVDKVALKKWTDRELASVHAQRLRKDVFYYEVG